MNRLLTTAALLTTTTACYPWIPGTPTEYKQVDNAAVLSSLTVTAYMGDYWEDGNSTRAEAQLYYLQQGAPLRWTDFQGGDAYGCSNADEPLDFEFSFGDPGPREIVFASKDQAIELTFQPDYGGYFNGGLDGSDVPLAGDKFALLPFEGPFGEISSSEIAHIPRAFRLTSPDLDGDSVSTLEVGGSDLDLVWSDAKADYYFVLAQIIRNGGAAGFVQCRTRDTEVDIDDRFLEDFRSGDQILLSISAVNTSNRYISSYGEMAVGTGTYRLLAAFNVE